MKSIVKLIAALLCAALFITMAACSGEGQNSSPPEQNIGSALPEEGASSDGTEDQAPDADGEDPGQAEEERQNIRYIRILTNGLNVRAKPSASSSVLGQVDKDMSMLYLGTENGFHKTYYRQKEAYVSAGSNYTRLHEMEPASETIERVIEEGTKIIGTPYVYGAVRYHNGKGKKLSGFSLQKFDCSSLTQYIYYQGSGTLLDLTTRTQVVQGEHVPRASLQRGDLMFFTNSSRYYKTGIERVGHVAVYLGENLILHTASDYCKIEEISAQRWKYYLESRRVVHI